MRCSKLPLLRYLTSRFRPCLTGDPLHRAFRKPWSRGRKEFDLEINWAKWKVTVEVTNDPGVSDWIRVFDTGAAGDVRHLGVSLSLSHPFMERFVGTDFDRIKPFVRLAAAIGLAEITASESGAGKGMGLTGEMRRNINQLLKDALSRS